MFRTKKDVDRHVQELFRKVKGEKERKCKYFNIARLYFQVGDYEAARKYASSFLSFRDDSSSAHKLLGRSLEALGQKENALAEYKCSLMLESNQPDLVLKVCELLADPDMKIDKSTAKYWTERAEQLFPHHQSVFKLKEKLVTTDEEHGATELERLILSELSFRPKDVSLHVRLLQLHLDNKRHKEAYTMAVEVEMRSVFREELKWYECLTDVFKAYAETTKPCGWEFFFHYAAILERAAFLNLQEQYGSPRRTWAQAVNSLFNFDQILEIASCQSPPSSEETLYQEFLKHYRAQLCLHFATALFKKAKREPSTWVDLSRAVAPLLLHALTPPVDVHSGWVSQSHRKNLVEWWTKEGAYRNSQAGHLLQSLVTERRTHFLERVMQFCTGNWRERLFQKVFSTRDHQQAIGTSHLVTHQMFTSPPLHIPSSGELRPNDELSQRLFPNSLHHMVWLGLRELSGCSKKGGATRLGTDFRCLVFENLQFTCNNPSLAGSETLCQLDIDAFLYASVLCARASLDEEQAAGFRINDRPQTLPASITDYLCTVTQAKWWTAAYLVYTNQARGDFGEIRQTLQRGVEVIRVLGNHGLDVRLLVQLARIFSERASVMATRSHAPVEMTEVESRAAMYWTSALPLLDKLQRNQTVRAPHARLFEYPGKELTMAEINTLLEEGRYFLACQMMKEEKHEKAIEAFQQLKSPYASFHQAMIYKKLAALELEEQQGELITSEMRSRHIILLTKVRECLYLTLDRLRSPGVDRKHPLNAELSAHIEEIESQLARIDPDVWRGDVNRNDLDGISDGSVSSGPSAGENGNSAYGYTSSFLTQRHLNSSRFNSTPYRNSHSHRIDSDTLGHDHSRRMEARPSPERLEAQIRHLMHGRDAQMQQVMQQNKALLESHRTVADNLNKVANSLEELKNLIQDLIKKDSHKRSESQMNSDLPQVGDPDDDLYVFDEDYSEEVNIPANHLGQYPAFPQYPNYPGASYRQISGMMGSSTVTYGPTPASADSTGGVPPPQLLPSAAGMGNFFRNVDPSLIYPQTLSYYGQGALPFSEGQQLPDFRAAAPGGPPGSVFSRLGAAPGAATVPGADSQGVHTTPKLNAPPSQPAPVNVVITSSDTLPTTVPQTQPTLSVTIPPQHRLGTSLVHSAVPPTVAGTLPQPPPGVPPGLPPGLPGVVAPVVGPGVPTGSIPFPGVAAGALSATLSGQLTMGTALPGASAVSSSSAVPHAFQISMPPQAQVPVASRLEKGAAALSPVLPISTQTLLSSVPSPVYSAVAFEKAGKEQAGSSVTTTSTSASMPGTSSMTMGAKASVTSLPKSSNAHNASNNSVGESEDGVDEAEHDPCPDFQPVIPLPAEVELTTGEEQEVVLFECRCKLFRFVDKEWKERGVGQLKLLHHQENGKVRLLMRREQVLKVCANHFLTPDMSLTRMKDKAWMWVANDFADEQMRLEKLCVRFKTPNDADKFADAFSNACELAKNAKTTPVKDSSARPQEACATITATTTPSALESRAEKIVVGGFTFSSPPKFTIASSSKTQAEKEVSKEKEKALTATKPSPFAQFSFSTTKINTDINTSSLVGSPLVKLPLSGSATISAPVVSVASSTPGERELPALRRPHLSSLVTSSSPALEVLQKEKPPEKDSAGGGDPLMFKASNLPTFSSLASMASDKPAFQANNSFKGFEGAGTPLFSKSPSGDTKKEREVVRSPHGGAGEEGEEEFVPTQEFAPVIAMPELVDVKTGEEEEEVIFQERAKLLRYDGDTKQWKERGTGTMKILKDPQSGRVRLLMRREQVLKVCCNHVLTAGMVFSVLQTCDRAWTWIAQDYSDGEGKAELFALRFKTVEQARAFGNKIEELKSEMVNDKVPVIREGSAARNLIKTTTASGISATTITSVIDRPVLPSSGTWKCVHCLFPNACDAKTCRSCSASKPHPPRDLVTPPPQEGEKLKLCEMFKPAAGSWECSSCYTINNASADHCVCCEDSRATRPPPKMQSEPFKPKQGAWECKNCFTRNEDNERRCASCGSDKPSATPTKQNGAGAIKPLSEMFKPKADSWECEMCLIRNDNDKIQCIACTTPKPGCEKAVKDKDNAEQSIFSSTFGLPSSGQSCGFIFGIPKQVDGQDSNEKLKTEMSARTSGFSFGVSSQAVFGTADTPSIFGASASDSALGVPASQSLFSVTPKSELSTSTSQPVFSNTVSQPVFGSWHGVFTGGTAATTSLTFGSPSITSTNAKTQSPGISSTKGSRPESDEPFVFEPVAFQFGTTSSTSKPFSFGVVDSSEKKDSPDTGPRNFVFGSPQSFEFNFSGLRPKSPVKSPKSPGIVGASGGEDESGSEPEEDEGEHIYFQPVIPLPDKVPVHTGEEEEDVLYSHRAKLFRFADGMWKERGVGDIKILKHRQTQKVRLVMRREQVLKLCLNHYLTADMIFSEKDEKSWFWTAADFAEGEIQQEKLAIRFQNKDIAVAFKDSIAMAQANLSTPTKSDALPSVETPDSKSAVQGKESGKDGVVRALFGRSTQLSKSPAVLDLSSNDDDVQVVYEFTVTPEEKAAAERLKLPPNFYSYKNLPPCPGCCGCEPESESEEKKPTKPAPSAVDDTTGLQSAKSFRQPLFSAPSSSPVFSSSSTILPPTTEPSSFIFTSTTVPSVLTVGSPSASVFGGSGQTKSSFFGASSQGVSVFGTQLPQSSTSITKAFGSFSFSPSENKDIKPIHEQSAKLTTDFAQKSDTSIFGKVPAATSPSVKGQTETATSSVFAPGTQNTSLFSQSFQQSKQSTSSIFSLPTTQQSFLQPSDKSILGQKSISSVSEETAKGVSIFGGTSTPSITPTFGVTSQNICSPANAVLFSSTFNVKSNSQPDKPIVYSVSSTTPDSKYEKEEKKVLKEQTEEGVPFLPTDSSLTFTSLASQGMQVPFLQADSSSSFIWAEAGAQVFKSSLPKTDISKPKESSSKKENGSSDEEEGTADDDTHDPQFEPIVALPDAIEVRTGEEEEQKVFCQRAKLYRYEIKERQWKERGVGEMKVLKHQVKGTYRLLLRREQVHKLVLNQLVTLDLELAPMAASDVAWCWYGMNFAEDEATGEICTDPKPEKLAVKFKTVELAKEFANCVQECVADLKTRPAASVSSETIKDTGKKEEILSAVPHTVEGEEESDKDKEDEENESDDDEDDDDDDEEEEEDDVDDDEDEEEDDIDDDDDDESDRNTMFEKRATLEVKSSDNDEWKQLGMGVLQIVYDHDNLTARVCMEADSSRKELCNTIISMNMDLKVHNKNCIWTAEDLSVTPPLTRTFKARFSSDKAAQEFSSIFAEGREIAQQCSIMEHIDPSEVSES